MLQPWIGSKFFVWAQQAERERERERKHNNNFSREWNRIEQKNVSLLIRLLCLDFLDVWLSLANKQITHKPFWICAVNAMAISCFAQMRSIFWVKKQIEIPHFCFAHRNLMDKIKTFQIFFNRCCFAHHFIYQKSPKICCEFTWKKKIFDLLVFNQISLSTQKCLFLQMNSGYVDKILWIKSKTRIQFFRWKYTKCGNQWFRVAWFKSFFNSNPYLFELNTKS